MQVLKLWSVLALVSLLAIGCGKKSGLEGKVVDGKGQPIANVKVVASQVQPIKGYEQFEATTLVRIFPLLMKTAHHGYDAVI